MNDDEMMRALQEKLRSRIASGDPCGPFYAAVVAADGTVVSEATNSVVPENCSHNHAEMNAIRLAELKLGTWNLAKRGLTLYTTAEPCMMCVGGILWSGIERIVYGVSTEAVERITGFDEGFKPRWREEFASRGISVVGPVASEVGEEVLKLYMSRQGVVYSPQRGKKCVVGAIALLALVTTALGGTHPLVTIRLNALSRPDDYRKIVEINRMHPGSADEYWFGRGGAGPRLEILKKRWRLQAERKKTCEAAGIACGFQQGVTLGHGSIYDPAGGGQAKAELHPFTDDAWQVDRDGNRMLMFCPRSPEVLRYEEEYAAALGETMRPVSFWLDDDLRLGFYKKDGCFCTNCLAAFGAKFGEKLTRAELVGRLFGPAKKDPVRRAWLDFLSESLAIYGAAARRGTDRTNPECLVAYQSVDAMTLMSGRDYAPLLRALSGDGTHPTSIRIGSGCYGEDLRALTEKMLGVAFEAERVRRSGLNLSAVSYEQETYRREALHKTPEAIAVESALALACGCDALTEYYWDEHRPEPLWYYEEFAATMSAWRPYFERLAALSRRTSLGGVARFIGGDFDLIAKRTLRSATDLELAGVGVPVTVLSSGAKILYVNADSLVEWGEGDAARLLAGGAVVLVDQPCAADFYNLGGAAVKAAASEGRVRTFDIASGVVRGGYPTHAERAALLDAFDALAGAKLPVRVERAHPLYVYPRVDEAGRVVAVTFYNGAAGVMLPTRVRIRRPVGTRAAWVRPESADLALDAQANGDELVLTLPKLPARQVATLLF